jgi:hypothetical protein
LATAGGLATVARAAYSCLSAIDPALLSARDLELLAGSAYMLGRDDAYVDAWVLA